MKQSLGTATLSPNSEQQIRYRNNPAPRPIVQDNGPMLKILVACHPREGFKRRDNDFFNADAGELVIPMLMQCLGAYADDECGCARSMIGLSTQGTTTVIQVKETDRLNSATFTQKVHDFLLAKYPDSSMNFAKKATELAAKALAIAAKYKAYDIIEYRDGRDSKR
jgi:hypothetical protein